MSPVNVPGNLLDAAMQSDASKVLTEKSIIECGQIWHMVKGFPGHKCVHTIFSGRAADNGERP